MHRVSTTGNRIIHMYSSIPALIVVRYSVLAEMSLQQDLRDASSTSSTMLNLRTLPEPGVSSGGGAGILGLSVKSLQDMITNDEGFDKQSKKYTRQKIGTEVKTEVLEISIEKSLVEEESVTINGDHQPISEETNLRIISLDEIAWHDTPDDCWFAIYDYVYDCTSFIKDHPGGDDVLLEYAGRDATLAFIGAGHSKFAQKTLERYLIGELPKNERIFRVDGGVKVYGI